MDEVVVIGAGVIGLTTAITLAEQGRQVLIRAAELPADTTSAVAGAMVGPVVADAGDPRVLGWLRHSDAVFRDLAGNPATGVRVAQGTLVGWPDLDRVERTRIPGYRPIAAGELPPELPDAFGVQLPVVDMPRYLRYLTDRFIGAGGRMEVARVPSLRRQRARVVVNCTGIGAAALTGDTDLHPRLGQHVIVDNPGRTDFLYERHPGGQSWTSYFSHGDRLVLGGVSVPDRWSREPDPRITEQILRRAARLLPELAGAPVRDVLVGLRPARSRVRVQAQVGDGPAGSATLLVHQYGHGANGVQLSWGSAADVARLVDGGCSG